MKKDHSNNQNPDEIEFPSASTEDSRRWGSDIIAEAIRNIDIEYLALNPGASFRGLHDSLVNHIGNRQPRMLLCLHEESAVSIAHGYAKVANRPMGVILHSNVGLMHGSMGIFNAWCDRVPMVILGATGPVDASQRRPWIDWIHTSADQGALVRNFTKWDDQPASVSAAIESISRAHQMTVTAPKGPVYVNLDVSLQEQLMVNQLDMPEMSRYRSAAPAAPNEEAVTETLALLSSAKKIVILVGRVSRSLDHWEQRVALSEALSATVITDLKQGAGFPTTHPLHFGPPGVFLSREISVALAEADVILSLDWMDLAGTFKQAFGDKPPKAKVIHASLDQQLHRGWNMEYFGLPPSDIYFMCDSDSLVTRLFHKLNLKVKPTPSAPPQKITPPKTVGILNIKAIADEINSQTADEDICLMRLPLGWNGGYRDFHHPLDYLGKDGGGGIGSGPGMCVGSALALKGSGRLPIGVIGDGDFLMGVTALWTACHYQIPLLMIIANNNSYFNDEMHQERVAIERDRPVENRWIGMRMSEPDIDLAGMARAQGALSFGPITDIAALQTAISKGLDAVRNGQVCVIDVRVAAGYDANLSGQVSRSASGDSRKKV
jgi:thiamine pyrophosphate-dependent acetolactate synthase large subunit-like protein